MDGENSKIPNVKESGEKGGQHELKAQGNTGTEGKECERDKGRKEEKTNRGVNWEEVEGLPRESSFGCLGYQFAQKCQCTVTFFPTAFPAAQPLLHKTTTHTHCGRAYTFTQNPHIPQDLFIALHFLECSISARG